VYYYIFYRFIVKRLRPLFVGEEEEEDTA